MRRTCWPLALAIVGAGVLRLLFSVTRRLVAGQVSLGVEYDLRNRMYAHLNSLELAFFDTQQTGQLMSRSTVDLQAVRFFLGYGLIFIVQSALTIVIAATVMFALDPKLAAVVAGPDALRDLDRVPLRAPQPPGHARRCSSGSPSSPRRPRRTWRGVRVVKAFAQEQRQLHRFNRAVARVFDQSMISTRLRAFYAPLIGFVPQLGLAALLYVGGRQAINGSLGHRRLRRLLRLRADAHLPDAHARHGARHGPARRGLGRARVRAARPRAAAHLGARRPAAARRRRVAWSSGT